MNQVALKPKMQLNNTNMKQTSLKKILAVLVVLFALPLLGAGCFNQASKVQGVATKGETSEDAAKAGITDDELNAIITTAQRFSERFGTYTNQDNFQNFQNLKIYATANMQVWMDGFVQQQQKKFKDQNVAFYGVTTKALTAKVLSARPDTIQILVNTERSEITDQTETPKVSYQNIIVEMKQQDNDWKVNFAQFQGS